MTTVTTVPISERALIARINRKLKPEGEKLKTLRGERWFSDLGRYYTVDENRNAVRDTHVNLEDWGRELGVLKAWERLAD